MKRYIYFLLSVVFALALAGCGGEDEIPQPDPEPPKPAPIPGEEERETPYYITDYLILNSIRAGDRNGWNDPENVVGYNLFPFQGHLIEVGLRGEAITEESNSELFTYFQEQYGDVNYTGKTRRHQNTALAYPIEKITMVCHENFDAEHPAGSAVDDIVKMHISTYETYINNGYEYPEDWEHRRYYDWGVMPVGEFYLSDVNEDNSILLPITRGMSCLKFMKEPDVPGEYPFTLTITMNGKEVSHTFKVTFSGTTDEE